MVKCWGCEESGCGRFDGGVWERRGCTQWRLVAQVIDIRPGSANGGCDSCSIGYTDVSSTSA
eukprot:3636496-Amphidinium_carterae.2